MLVCRALPVHSFVSGKEFLTVAPSASETAATKFIERPLPGPVLLNVILSALQAIG